MKHFQKLLLGLAMLTLLGCNKQKAEALKIAAENFRGDTIESIDLMNALFQETISITALTEEQEINQITTDLQDLSNSASISASILNEWTADSKIGLKAQGRLADEFQKIKNQYYTFEDMFNSLEEGSYFAKDAVKRSEEISIKLTMQLVNYAQLIDELDFPFNGKRADLILQMQAAKKETNAELQAQLFKLAATNFIVLRKSEEQAKKQAITSLLKAAHRGQQVSELIRNYDKMSIQDLLVTIKEGLNYVNTVSGGSQNVTDALSKLDHIETTITSDPYWNVLLNQPVN